MRLRPLALSAALAIGTFARALVVPIAKRASDSITIFSFDTYAKETVVSAQD